ncbi:MAG: Phosphate transport system permease protein [Chloroflexi bacterium]|nr:Phosphate transport system permease protein [Chloroflexota bacterium]
MTAAPAPFTRRTPLSERLTEAFLRVSAALGILTTVGIVAVLAFEAVEFFRVIPVVDYLTGTVWSASIKPFRFGVLPLVTGTLLVAGLALIVAIPLGLLSGIYLAEYASQRVRTTLKPILELIAGIPTVVLGFFAINFISPVLLKSLVPGIGGFSVLAGGIVVGILVTPLIATLSEDAMRAVPRSLREGAVAMGATKFEVVRRVVVPAALSGIMASIILAMSRAVGETMAVVLAVGANPQLTLDVRESVQTMTAFIVQISLGDTPAGSIQFKALFAVGATLFLMTLGLNLLSDRVVARFRNRY